MNLIRNKRNRIEEEREFYGTESVSCKVNGPLALLLRISRIIGVAHLRFVPLNKAYRVSLCPYCVFHLYIYLACILLVAVVAYAHDHYVEDPKRSIRTLLGLSDLFFKVDFILSNVIVIVAISDVRNRMKRLIKYIHNIETINNNISHDFLNLKLKKCKTIMYCFFTVQTAFAVYDISDSIINVVKDELDFIIVPYALCFYIKCIIRLSIQMQFFLIVSLLNESLELINMKLIDLSLKLKLFRLKSIDLTSAHTMNRRLFHAYLLICSNVVEINREEGTIVMLILTYTALDTMNFLYIMASAVTSSVESVLKFLNSEKVTIMWFIYQISSLFLWMEPCHRTQDKFQAILNTVSKLMCTPSRVKLPVLFSFCEIQIPKFRPHGICDFTRSIMATIFGVMATFLIIVRQFNIKDKIYSEELLE